jgi:isocitrate dehydrogenase (NAD+)
LARHRVVVIPGDGIGPEVVEAALHAIEPVSADIEFTMVRAGLAYYRETGKPYPDNFFETLSAADAVLKGPLATPVGPGGYRSINVAIRQRLDLYANLRPCRGYPGVSPKVFDIVVVRENTEGLYAGVEGRFRDEAYALKIVTERGSERIIRFAFNYASAASRRRVTCVHKANILKLSDGLFLDTFRRIAEEHPGIEHDDLIVDAAAYNIARSPEKLDVIVTMNLYGDILSDLVAGVAGSLGLCGSGQYGPSTAVFEPVHGAGFDIAGKGIANPVAAIHAARLMLDYLGTKKGDQALRRAARLLDRAVEQALVEDRVLTPDLGGTARTMDVAQAVRRRLEALLEQQ